MTLDARLTGDDM